MGKLLVVCGPTATGKTELGVKLAKKYNGEIVSADSRQVYRNMDIATGKDLPVYDSIPVWMLDVVRPRENFSVALYCRLASRAIEDILKRGKLPIIVGGTGFYIKALVDGIATLNVPPNPELRQRYSNKTAKELFDILFHLDSDLANSLNHSERNNKVRLLRKIEITQSQNASITRIKEVKDDLLMIGLRAPPEVLRKRIEKRIDDWVKMGLEDEILRLLQSGVPWNAQSMNALGYRQWRPYFEGKATREEVVKIWKQDEWQSARRQMTWFGRDERIKWFDVTSLGWEEKVEETVGSWYTG